MGKEKQTSTVVQNSTTTPTPTAEETRLNQLQLQDYEQSQPGRQAVNTAGLNLAQQMLEGRPLPGYLGSLPGGISEDVTGGIVQSSLRDLNTQLAASGAGTFLESGSAQQAGVRTAGDIRNQAAQFNLQNLQQLLNLAVGGQAVPLAYGESIGGQLGQRLAGLRSVNQTGNSNTTNLSMNPFMKSFQQSAGTSLGKGIFFG